MNPNQPSGPYAPVPPRPFPGPGGFPPPGRQRNKGCLYAVIGGAALLFLMVACGALVGSTSGTAKKSPSPSATAKASKAGKKSEGAEPKRQAKPEKPVNGIGREYRDGKFAFTVTKVKKGVRRVGSEYFGRTAQGQYVFVYVTVDNIGNKPRTFSAVNQTLMDTRGRKFDADTEATLTMSEESKALFEDINPGNSVKGILIFDVPRGVKLKEIDLHDSMFSGGVTVPLGNR